MLGERGEYEGPSRLLATGTVHLFQTFLLETRLLRCVPRPVGLHQQVKRIPSRVFLSFSFQKDYANKKDRHYGASSPLHSETWDLWWVECSLAKSMGSPVRRVRCRKVKGGMEFMECSKRVQLIPLWGDVAENKVCGGGEGRF